MDYTKLDEVRFWSNVSVSYKDSCWYWKKSKHKFGYGYFRIDKKTYLSHRLSLVFWSGKDMMGLFALHKCGNPSCCNPFHLYWGTAKDNYEDSVKDGTHINPPKPDFKPPVMYGEENPTSIMNKVKVEMLRRDRGLGLSLTNLSKKYGISKSTVSQIINFKTWRIVL